MLNDLNKLCELISDTNTYSYNYLCEYIGDKKKTGESRQIQFREWNKYVLIKKVGKKYQITRERTLTEKDEYKLQGTYLELLETLMYSYLVKLPNNSLTITIPKLMERMYLVNKNYSYGKYNKEQLSELISTNQIEVIDNEDISFDNINRFFTSTETNYRHRVKVMLKDMESKALISPPHEWLCLGIKNNNFTTIRRATKDEYEHFLKIQTDLLQEHYMFVDEEKIYRPKRKDELNKSERFGFYQMLMTQAKRELNCEFYSYEYDLVINKVGIQEHLIMNIKNLQSSINDKVKQQLLAKDNYLSLVNWFIDKDTNLNLKKILEDNKKHK